MLRMPYHSPPQNTKDKNKRNMKSSGDHNDEAASPPMDMVAARSLARSLLVEDCGVCRLTYHLPGRLQSPE